MQTKPGFATLYYTDAKRSVDLIGEDFFNALLDFWPYPQPDESKCEKLQVEQAHNQRGNEISPD